MPRQTAADDVPGRLLRAVAAGMVRTAALPVSHPSATHTRAGIGPGEADDPERLAAYLLGLVKDPVVREAIEVSSGALSATLSAIEDGTPVPDAKLRRAALAVTRYVLRMTGRPTPFGLLAGVQTARFGGDALVRIGSRHRKYARPDAAWLDDVVGRLHHDGQARDALLVVANNLCTVRGDRLVSSYVRTRQNSPSEPVPHEMTIGYTPAVRVAVEAARRPLPFAALHRAVRERFPEAQDKDIDRLLVGLVDHEVLLTDVASRQDQPDQLAYVNARLSSAASDTAAGLRRVEELLAGYSASAPGEGRGAWHEVVATMGEVHARATRTEAHGIRPPVHVDLRVDGDIRLPDDVIDEAARAGAALWRLAPDEGQYQHLMEYHRAFLDRFGTDRTVLVRDLLDPHLGLGAPAGYRVPRSDRACGPAPAVPYPAARDEVLGDAVHEVLASGAGAEPVLDESLLARLTPERAGTDLPPGSLDLCVQPLARSVGALSAGDFRLLVTSGSYTAGAMTGRFQHVIGAERQMSGLYREPETDDPLPVQLFFQPRSARSANVSRVPLLSSRAVAVGCFLDTDGSPGQLIDLDDLAVGATRDRLFLVQASTGREITILRPSMLNITTEAPNMARFLAGVGMSSVRPWAPWQWSRLEALPYLPRVRYGRTVLSPARWRPAPELRDPGLPRKDWLRALERWRTRHAVPNVLRVSVLDHHLDLDLTAPMHQQVLRTQLVGQAIPLVQESPLADPAELGWSGGYVTEVVVPLVPTRSRAVVPAMPRPSASYVRHAPGGEWLYAKVYVARDRLDTLLVRHLPSLLERVDRDVDRWFFLRYADPGAHLRLRLHGEPGTVRGMVLPALHEWAESAAAEGAIRKLVLDTYEPETVRYGGPGALAPAERLFHADSRLVTHQLVARASGRLRIPVETLAALNHAALLDAFGSSNWWHWVLTTYPIDLQNDVPTAQRRAATKLIDSTGHVDPSSGFEGDNRELLSLRAEVTRAALEYARALGVGTAGGPSARHRSAMASVLHMHSNRLLGTDPAAERRSYGLLRSVVRHASGRAEHA